MFNPELIAKKAINLRVLQFINDKHPTLITEWDGDFRRYGDVVNVPIGVELTDGLLHGQGDIKYETVSLDHQLYFSASWDDADVNTLYIDLGRGACERAAIAIYSGLKIPPGSTHFVGGVITIDLFSPDTIVGRYLYKTIYRPKARDFLISIKSGHGQESDKLDGD